MVKVTLICSPNMQELVLAESVQLFYLRKCRAYSQFEYYPTSKYAIYNALRTEKQRYLRPIVMQITQQV